MDLRYSVEQITSWVRRRLVRGALMVLVLAVATAALLTMDRGQGIPVAMRHKSATTHVQASGDLRQLVLGTWEDDYQGKRTLTVRPDGTATMLVEFDGWKARMFTPRLQIETTWAIEEGRFNRHTVGGEPPEKVAFVKGRVGDRASDKIVKLTADRMVLIDQDGETRYNWRRVK